MSTLELFRTEKPSVVIFADEINNQFFTASTRNRGFFRSFSTVKLMLDDIIKADKEIGEIDYKFGSKHFIRLRSILVDSKHASYMLEVDYLHDKDHAPIFSEESLKERLNDGGVVHDGQGQWVEVNIVECFTSSDSFDPVSDEYYS